MIFSFFRLESPHLYILQAALEYHHARQRAFVVVLKVGDEMGLMTQVRVRSDEITDDPVVYKKRKAGRWVVFNGRPRSVILIVRLRFRPIDQIQTLGGAGESGVQPMHIIGRKHVVGHVSLIQIDMRPLPTLRLMTGDGV